MGNNVVTGHMIAKTGLDKAVGWENALQVMMVQNNIEPWSPKDLLKAKLIQQQELAKRCPFRFISVVEGLDFFAQHCGGWVFRLTRDQFVKLANELVAKNHAKVNTPAWKAALEFTQSKMGAADAPQARRPSVPSWDRKPWEAAEFYDVFDSIDIDCSAVLSMGEVAGCLEVYFWGGIPQRVGAIYDVLSGGKETCPQEALESYVKTFVWAMVPDHASSMRPMLLGPVCEDLIKEIDTTGTGGLTKRDLIAWHEKAVGNNVLDRVAAKIDGLVYAVWLDAQNKQKLAAYGNKTYEAQYGARGVIGNAAQVSPVTHQVPAVPVGQMITGAWSSATNQIAGVFQGQPQAGEVSPRGRTVSAGGSVVYVSGADPLMGSTASMGGTRRSVFVTAAAPAPAAPPAAGTPRLSIAAVPPPPLPPAGAAASNPPNPQMLYGAPGAYQQQPQPQMMQQPGMHPQMQQQMMPPGAQRSITPNPGYNPQQMGQPQMQMRPPTQLGQPQMQMMQGHPQMAGMPPAPVAMQPSPRGHPMGQPMPQPQQPAGRAAAGAYLGANANRLPD